MSINNYYDEYGRLHHKPCIDGKPSSNNGWIYSAYAKKLGLPITFKSLIGLLCAARTRHPYESAPPISRDEILGLVYLGFMGEHRFNGWSFSPFPLPKLNPIKLVKQLLQAKGQHRNYFWENNLDQIYHVAFSVPLVDRAFILRCWGETTSLRYLFYRTIEGIDRLSTTESGIRWLKYGTGIKGMQSEFPEDHPLRA